MQKFAYFSKMLYFCTLILELTMKYVFTYLLLLVGLVSASASPIYAWESVNRSQMQSQQIMRSGVAYSGTIYTPFDNTSPSEYHPVAAGQDQDASGGRHGHIRKEKILGPDTPPANQSPIGEPWILALFAAIMAGIIAIKHQNKQRQQTAKNIMTMQNNNIKSEGMWNVCKRYVLRMFYVFMILFTIGIGDTWGWTSRQTGTISSVYVCGDMNSWSTNNSKWALSKIDNNHWKGTFYIKGQASNVEFKLYINCDHSDHYSTGYNYHKDWTGGEAEVYSTGKGNASITPRNSSTSAFIKLTIEFYASYGTAPHGYLSVSQEDVSALSPSLSASSTSIPSGTGTSTITASCSGGSGSYTYSYTCRNTTDGTNANSCLSATSGSEITFNAPAVAAEKSFRITVTATDANSQLTTDLSFPSQTATKDITVNLVPSLNWAASNPISPTTAVAGENITLTVVRANSSANITYYYSTNNGTNWTSIETSSSQTCTFTTPANTGATKSYVFKAEMSDGGTKSTGKSSAATVYGKKTIHVRNTNNWATFKMHHWGDAAATSMPGNTDNISSDGGQWYSVVILSSYSGFILNDGAASGGHQSYDLNYGDYSDGGYYAFATSSTYTGGANKHTLSESSAPAAPSATTNEATVNSATSLTFNYSVGANRDRTTPGVAYKQSDSNIADAATIYSSGTHYDGTVINDGNASGTISNKTITAGKDWYYVAYGTNGFGTTYGSIRKIRTTGITLNKKGGSSGSDNFVALGGKTISAITVPGKTGYTFAGYWTSENDDSGTKYFNANGSANVSNWPTNLGASLTLYAHWTPNQYDVTLKLNTGTGTDNQVVQATYAANMPLVLKTSGSAISVPTKTGYTLQGYWDTDAASGGTQYYTYIGSPKVLGSARTWNKASATNLYARWQANTYTLTLKKYNGQDDAEATATYDATISVTPPAKTGYTFTGYWTESSGGTKIIAADGHFVASVASWTNSGKQWRRTSDETLHAQWTANKYDVTLKANTGTGADQVVQATYDADMPTTLKVGGGAVTVHTKTGYNLLGYWDNASTGNQYYNYNVGTSTLSSYRTWNKTSATNLFAHWSPKNYTVTLDVDEANKGNIASATTSQDVTYDGATTTVPNRPTAAQGYALYGYYTDHNGTGTKVINADGTWIASVTGYTDGSKRWVHDGDVTLYAYYKNAEVTLALNHDAFEPLDAASGDNDKDYVIATPTISPTPAGSVTICWELLYENDNPVPSRTALDAGGNAKKFSIVGLATGSYKVRATLHTGSGDCGSGTTLDVYDASFTIAGDHTINVLYKDADGNSILTSSTNPGKPLETTSITAPTITGYTFTKWKAGEGITIVGADASGEKASETIEYYASFAGNLTAIYTKKNMIYFYNTLGWSDVYVYFYSSDKYWVEDHIAGQGCGTGSDKDYSVGGSAAYYRGYHGHMTQIAGTNIWYYDYEAEHGAKDGGEIKGYDDVVFVETEQNDYKFFYNNKASRRGDFKHSLSMFVPLDNVTKTKNGTKYYNDGYWMNYPENTGYTLRIYSNSGDSEPTRTIRFPFSNDKKMPLKLDVEFNGAATNYYFNIYREDGTVLSASYGMNTDYHSDVRLNNPSPKISIKTTAPGIYTFTLVYKNTPNLDYYISVDYPISNNDYRILYSDNATWSQGSAHTAGWSHPSDVIRKNTDAEVTKYDTVSFYVSKGAGISVTMKFQYASNIIQAGTITWADVPSGSITIPSSVVTKPGVYNFIIKQVGTAEPEVEKVEPYTGNYYIRTDNAGSTKWDYYRSRDHQMVYTEFSSNRETNTFGELYTHYFTSWCERGANIKFCIANDYSSCISDTLAQDVGNPFGNTNSGGTLNSDGSATALDDRYSANVRFMYNETTNKICRAYVGSSTNKARKFLVLKADNTIEGEDEEAISEQGITNGVILQDKQNWMYEEILYIIPGTKFKLFACYAEETPTEANAQYFRGEYEATNNPIPFGDTKSVVLIGGSGAKQKARVIYDFKTNRLMAAWIPSGSDVSGDMVINADVLVEREHHEPAQYITFANASSQLSGVKTVYGAMKFNRWILNNRGGSSDDDPDHGKTDEQLAVHHPPLAAGQQKSIYERSLYFISFPFDVKVSDIFGFGHYWDEWYLEYYDGLNRAKNGYWIDSPPNWKYVTPEMADTMVLRKYVGYILGLDLDYMQANNYNFWTNGISTIELFFPSTTNQETLKQTTVTIPALSDEYECKINRDNGEGDRRVKDSYWRCIGTPSFNIYNTAISDGTGTITWKTDYTWKADKSEFPFIYMWNKGDNTLTAQSTSTFTFLPMHSYLVQNGKQIVWTDVSAKPVSPIVARRTNDMPETEYEWRLALMSDSNLIDQTFVRMTNLEQVTDSFDFGQDLSKELNATRSNIYSFIGYERAAANSMTLNPETTTVIPLGLNIIAAGEYTLAMPDGTHGVGVTLVDTQTNERTNLSAGMAQTVTLAQGDYLNRFFLEISPIHNAPTGIEEVTGNGLPTTGARKVLIDGILYIVKDGQLFDATGKRVE